MGRAAIGVGNFLTQLFIFVLNFVNFLLLALARNPNVVTPALGRQHWAAST